MKHNFRTMIEQANTRYSKQPAFFVYSSSKNGRSLSYGDAVKKIGAVIEKIQEIPGDFIALFSENSPEWTFCYFGAVLAGKTVIPVDEQMQADDFLNIMNFTGCSQAIVSPQIKVYEEISQKFSGTIHTIAEFCADSSPLPKLPDLDPDRTVSLIFTSGTTGDPKGVELSERNFVSNLEAIEKYNIVKSESRVLAILPFHHCYAFMTTLLLPYYYGIPVVYLASLASENILAAVNKFGVTHIVGVPGLYCLMLGAVEKKFPENPTIRNMLWKLNTLLAVPAANGVVLPAKIVFSKIHAAFGGKLSTLVSGGAKLDEEVGRKFLGFGFKVVEGYGLTETSPILTITPPERIKPGSCGTVVHNVKLKIDSQNGADGEICVSGPNIMKGYYKKPSETAEVLQSGWFKTGDIGHVDDDGYLFITGRAKEIIVLSNGKNIYPEEVESSYSESPYIKELCVYAQKTGSAVKLNAIVVPDIEYFRKTGVTDITGRIKYEIENISVHLPSYMRLSGIKTTADPLARTRLGKLRRSLIASTEYALIGDGEKVEKEPAFEQGTGKSVYEVLCRQCGESNFGLNANLEIDLGLDSLSKLNFFMNLQKETGKKLLEKDYGMLMTVKDVIAYLDSSTEEYTEEDEDIFRKKPDQPITDYVTVKRGNMVRGIVSGFAKTFRYIFNRIFGFEVRGLEHIKKSDGPLLICPNHISYLDAFAIFCSLPDYIAHDVFFLGHADIFNSGVPGLVRRLMRVIPTGQGQVMKASMQYAVMLLKTGRYVGIFPEGGRSIDGYVKEPKTGAGIIAAEAKVKILPVHIKGLSGFLSRSRRKFSLEKVTVSYLPVMEVSDTPEKTVKHWYELMRKEEK